MFQRVIRSERNINLAYQVYVYPWYEPFHHTKLRQIAARLGIYPHIKELLKVSADANVQGGHYDNALQAAASEGHETVVQLPVDRGADVNTQGSKYGNALQTAALKGSEAVARLLVDRGANINANTATSSRWRHGRVTRW